MKHDLNVKAEKHDGTFSKMLGRLIPRSEKIFADVDDLWVHLTNDVRKIFVATESGHVHPRVDILENKDIYDVRVDLPGVDANSIDLQAKGNRIILKAKRSCSEASDFKMAYCEHKTDVYERGIHLAEDAVVDERSATLSDGILSIRIPRKAA